MPTVRTSHAVQIKPSVEHTRPMDRAPHPNVAHAATPVKGGWALTAQMAPRVSLAAMLPLGFAGAAAARSLPLLGGVPGASNPAQTAAPILKAAQRLPLGKIVGLMLLPKEAGRGSYISPSAQPRQAAPRHQNPALLLREGSVYGASAQLQTIPPPRGVTIEVFPQDSDASPTLHRGKEGAPTIVTQPSEGLVGMPPDPRFNLHAGGQTRVDIKKPEGFKEHSFDIRDFFHLSAPDTDIRKFDWYSSTMKPGQKPPSLKFKHVEVKSSNLYRPSETQAHFPTNQVVHLDFTVGSALGGRIDIRWLEPEIRRDTVAVDLTRSAALPEVPSGEILAHALGLVPGFVPSKYFLLNLKHKASEPKPLSSAPHLVAQTALGLLGKQGKQGLLMPGLHDYISLEVSPQFRATPKYFGSARVDTGASFNGPGLDDPKLFPNIYPSNAPGYTMQLLTPEQLAQHGGLEPGSGLDAASTQNAYVVVLDQNGNPELRLGRALMSQGHFTLAQGQPVLAAGVVHMVYDPALSRHRIKFLDDNSGHYQPYGKYAKQIAEQAFEQTGLGGAGRWLPTFGKPVSTQPFAGLKTTRTPISKSETSFFVDIPDLDFSLRAKLALDGQHLLEIENIGRSKQEKLPPYKTTAQFLPTLLGQALASAAAEQGHPFRGIKIGDDVLNLWGDNALIDGLTIYGIDTRQIVFSANRNVVIDAGTQHGKKLFRLDTKVPVE